MANIQLNLTQRSQMANSETFLQRLNTAMKGTAQYWKDFTPTQFDHYNVAVKKKKEFARKIFSTGVYENIRAYAAYLLNQYRYDDAGEPDIDETGQLSDNILMDSSPATATFEYFAGVEFGDETKQIVL